MSEVDLERLASGYEHRNADLHNEDRAIAAAHGAALEAGAVVVDIGGGRGGHAAAFTRLGVRAVVVDVAPAMALAAHEAGMAAVVGDAHRLPVRDGAADLAYFHLSLHHGEPAAMLEEARRVTRPGGTVWVWTLSDAHHREAFLTRWFPSVAEIDARRFPAEREIVARMTDLGLGVEAPHRRTEHITRSAGSWERAVRAGFVSTLHLVPDEEIESGLDRFREVHPDPEGPIEYDLPFVGIAGRRPSLRS